MITPNETMWIIVLCFFMSLSMTAYSTWLLGKEIKKLKNAILGESEQ